MSIESHGDTVGLCQRKLEMLEYSSSSGVYFLLCSSMYVCMYVYMKVDMRLFGKEEEISKREKLDVRG